jgi:predicted ATPase
MEPGVFGLSYAALVLWYLGYPDQARQKSTAAWTLAQERSDPYSLAAARVFAATSHQLCRERLPTQERAEAAITLAREQGFPVWLGQGTILRGWALAEHGQIEEGITQMRQGLVTDQAIGAGLFQSYYLALLAEAYGKAGQVEEGLAPLAEALTVVDTSGGRFYEAELYRLRGELMLAQSRVQSLGSSVQKEAEECFLRAIEIARHQQAKSLELRAVMSLSRLRQQQGKKEEARQMLAEIYGWFTEGFDTKDLQEAKALLDEFA